MVQSLNSSMSIFIMIGLGFFLTKKGLFSRDISKLFSKIVIKISLPLMMIVSIPYRFTKEKLLGSLGGILIAFLSIITIYILAIIISNILKLDAKKKGVFVVMFTFSNTIFIGLPINISLFGEASATYVFLFYLANTTLFWTLGIYNIRKGSYKDGNTNFFKKLLSPPFLGFLIGMALVILDIKLPMFLTKSFSYIGDLTTPLSMFYIGIVISYINLKDIKLYKDSFIILLGRFIIAPLITLLYLNLIEFPDILKNVFIIEAMMPIITQAALSCEFYDNNSEYVSMMVGLSTIIGMLVVPIYSIIL